MSKISDKIKQLQITQKKIDYVNYIIDILKSDVKCVDYLEVKDDVLSKIEPFLTKLISVIEDDTLPKVEIVEAKSVFKEEISTQSKPQTPQLLGPSHQEQINFALDNRHLSNKKVSVIGENNINVQGTVVGLDAPHVLIKTDTGPTIKVPLEKVVLQ